MIKLLKWLRIEWLGRGAQPNPDASELEKMRHDLEAAKEAVRALQRRIDAFSLAYPDLFRLYFTKNGEEQRKRAEAYRKKAIAASPRFRRAFKMEAAK